MEQWSNYTPGSRSRFDNLTNEMNRRFDEMNREPANNRELADNHERMAKLGGSLEGFLARRRTTKQPDDQAALRNRSCHPEAAEQP